MADQVKPGYFDENAETVVEKALRDAWVSHAEAFAPVYTQTMGELANYDVARGAAALSTALAMGGHVAASAAAMAVSCWAAVPTLFSRGDVMFGPDQRSSAFFAPVESDETYYDRVAAKAGLPIGRNYLILSKQAAVEVAAMRGGFAECIRVITKETAAFSELASKTEGGSRKRQELAKVFSAAVALRSNNLASCRQVAQNIFDDVSREGVAVAMGAMVAGCIAGVPALVMSGAIIGYLAIYPKSNPLRNPALDIPVAKDPDISACRLPDGGVMFGLTMNGVRRMVAAEPAAMSVLVDETQRLVLVHKAAPEKAPKPAPKQG